MARKGQFVVTESEPVFDAADVVRCGLDIFVQLSHVRFQLKYLTILLPVIVDIKYSDKELQLK